MRLYWWACSRSWYDLSGEAARALRLKIVFMSTFSAWRRDAHVPEGTCVCPFPPPPPPYMLNLIPPPPSPPP